MQLLNSFATIICPLNSRESDAEGLRILRGPINCQNQSCNDHHHHQCHQYHPHPRHLQPYTHLNASLMGQQALVAATSPSAYISQVSRKETSPRSNNILTSPSNSFYPSNQTTKYFFHIRWRHFSQRWPAPLNNLTRNEYFTPKKIFPPTADDRPTNDGPLGD